VKDLWIFGYGSLVWRPAFEYRERRPGFITGWARRFWQGSTDHRGVPEAPGRVVTLVPREGERCWGVVYRVDPSVAPGVLAKLDHREQGGYARHRVDVDVGAALVREALVYLATPENPHYAGAAPPEEIAAQILRCRGPSGTNLEYALRLADALRAMNAEDEHVFTLEALLRGENRA
jgi:glutathione-specific gamma-glutamylcyclotransferase